MEHTSAFTSIIDSQLLPMRVGIVFLMGCCILAAYCTNKRKNIEKKEYQCFSKATRNIVKEGYKGKIYNSGNF